MEKYVRRKTYLSLSKPACSNYGLVVQSMACIAASKAKSVQIECEAVEILGAFVISVITVILMFGMRVYTIFGHILCFMSFYMSSMHKHLSTYLRALCVIFHKTK